MIDVEIEPHSDRVGRDDVIHIAVLIEIDLRVPRSRTQSAEHDRRSAPLALDEFRNRVNFLGGEGDDRGARRQARYFSFARETQLRKSRSREDRSAGKKLLDERFDRRGANQQGFLTPAPMQQAIREDMPAVEVGGELNFVDGDEIKIEIARHGLDRRDEITRRARFDLFLACDERDLLCANSLHDAAIDLARQKPQRQSDHARRIGEHPLDGVMRLAGVGWTKNRGDARCPRKGSRTRPR